MAAIARKGCSWVHLMNKWKVAETSLKSRRQNRVTVMKMVKQMRRYVSREPMVKVDSKLTTINTLELS